jgi:hypothetical protein
LIIQNLSTNCIQILRNRLDPSQLSIEVRKHPTGHDLDQSVPQPGPIQTMIKSNSHRLRYFTREVSVFDVGPVNPTITVVFVPSAVQILRPVINSSSYSTVKYRRGNALDQICPKSGPPRTSLTIV